MNRLVIGLVVIGALCWLIELGVWANNRRDEFPGRRQGGGTWVTPPWRDE